MPTNTKVAPIVLGVGAAALVGLGIYFWTKKPEGYDPGDILKPDFSFQHRGSGGDFILRIALGYHRFEVGKISWFDEEEGLGWDFATNLELHDELTLLLYKDLECPIPAGAKPYVYDGMGSIRTPDMPPEEYLERIIADKVTRIREE